MASVVMDKIGEVVVYRQMARAIHGVVRRSVQDLSQEDSLIQPKAEGNCANWVMGHLLHVYEMVLPALGQQSLNKNGGFERFKRGGEGLKGAEDAIGINELVAAWDEASKRVEAGLEALTAKQLDEKAPFSPGNNPNETVRSLLTTMFFHQAYHTGQLGLLRRMAGKPGAIG
jgi:uncharacterized damage-inducible protein DinB